MWFKPKATRNRTLKSPRQTLQCPGIPALIHQSERGLEATLVSKQLRKGAVSSCKPPPSSPKDLMHHDHRYRLFAGSDLRRSCQCLSATSLGGTQRKTTGLPSKLLAHSQALGEGWMKPQRGAVYFFLHGTGVSNAWGCRDPKRSHLHSLRDLWEEKMSYKCKLWSKNTHLLGI